MTAVMTGAWETVRPRLGDVSQVASVRPVTLDDGPERGVRALDVRTAGGLHVLVLTDRGMDLGPAWCEGHPLAWISPTGVVHPSLSTENGWLRSFHGGLLVTAGLQNVGDPCVDGGETHGLHGRASSLPARGVRWDVLTGTGMPVVEITGTLRETAVYGADLVLSRTLRLTVGEPVLELRDVVENRGFESAALMILYHFNIGWPVADVGARFVAPARAVIPYERRSNGVAQHERLGPPRPGAPEEVFEHVLEEPPEEVTVGVVNERFDATGGLGVSISYHPRELPRLWQWQTARPGLYLVAVEPANCGISGRSAERAGGAVDVLAPGERRTFALTLRAHTGAAAARFAAVASGAWKEAR